MIGAVPSLSIVDELLARIVLSGEIANEETSLAWPSIKACWLHPCLCMTTSLPEVNIKAAFSPIHTILSCELAPL